MNPDLIIASREIGEDEARAIAARYGVGCAPDVPVLRARRGAMVTLNPDDPRTANENSFRAMLRRQRFEAAARKRGRA